jgi:N-methylhydantoinase A
MNLRVTVVGKRPKFDLSILAPAQDGSASVQAIGSRQVWADGAWHDAAIYERLVLPVDSVVQGPAILEQPDTTIFVDPDLEGRVDRFGNLLITRKDDD